MEWKDKHITRLSFWKGVTHTNFVVPDFQVVISVVWMEKHNHSTFALVVPSTKLFVVWTTNFWNKGTNNRMFRCSSFAGSDLCNIDEKVVSFHGEQFHSTLALWFQAIFKFAL